MKTLIPVSLALAIALSIGVPADAHHAAAGIDRSTTVTVEGTVREFRWANPHSWIEMEVVNDDGETEIWNLEMFPPSFLVRAGWTSTTIKPGDEVAVTANPFMDGTPGGIFVSIRLPNGEELGGR